MKVEWLVTNVTAVGSPDGAKCDILGMNFGVLRPIQAAIVVGESLCDEEIPFGP